MKYFWGYLTIFVATCLTATTTFAAELIVADNGDGKYSVNGFALNGVAGIELVIGYDSSSLSSPSVAQGSLIAGATMAANTNIPGTIKVAIITTKPFSGSGQVIAVNFAAKTGAGGITSINARMINLKYETLPAQASVGPAAQTTAGGSSSGSSWPFSQDNSSAQQPQQTVTTPKPSTTTTAAPSIGILTLADEGKQDSPKKQEQAVQPSPQQEQTQAPITTAKADENRSSEARAKSATSKGDDFKKTAYTSVLERFRTFKGERQLAALAELFTKPVAAEAVQEPTLAISDGKGSTRLLAKFGAADDNSAPNFATTEAKIITLKSEETTGRWIIDLTPAKDALTPSVSILLGNHLYEIPLVVVPPVRKLTFSEKEIAAFLKDYGAGKPDFDLNSDGRHDYLDDYLYTGHYLLSRKNVPAPPAK